MTLFRYLVLGLALLAGVMARPGWSWAGPDPGQVELPTAALESLRHMAIQHNGRVKPLDSFAWEVLDRLTGDPRWGGRPPVETVLFLVSDPASGQEAELLSVPFIPLREALGLGPKTTRVSYSRLMADRRLMRMLPAIVQKQQNDEKLTMLENEAMELYDRFVLVTGLFQQELNLVPPPGEGNVWAPIADPQGYPAGEQQALQSDWANLLAALQAGEPAAIESASRQLAQRLRGIRPSAYPPGWRIRLEMLYNDWAPFRVARWLYAFGAFLLWFVITAARAEPVEARAKRSRFVRPSTGSGRTAWVGAVGFVFLLCALVFHGAGIVTRVVLGGRPPVSNFYETMLWLPFVGVILAIVFERIYRSGFFAFSGSLLASVALLLADHLPLDSSISPVVAVLRSNLWLTIHVLTIVGSYAPLALAAVLAHLYAGLYLFRRGGHPALPTLALFLYRCIQVGVVLLAAGIMLGAVWANASWGRYWGWDPKETWALITLLWFVSLLHGRHAGWAKGIGLALGAIGGFFLLLMTYYGVSFYLVGLHSYAGGSAKPIPPLLTAWLLLEVGFMVLVGGRAILKQANHSHV